MSKFDVTARIVNGYIDGDNIVFDADQDKQIAIIPYEDWCELGTLLGGEKKIEQITGKLQIKNTAQIGKSEEKQ